MKYAKVTQVRDIEPGHRTSLEEGNTAKRKRIEQLLRNYPVTTEAETLEIRHFLATGSHLEVGLVSGSDEFREKVRAFRKDHRKHFRLKAHEVILFLAAIGGPIMTLIWRYLG